MKDLHQPTDYAIGLYCGSESATQLEENPIFHARTKPLEVQHHFIRENVLQGDVCLIPIPTSSRQQRFQSL